MPNLEPPKVTGLSPKEGPPGTKITIRGENLGISQEDVVGLSVCGVDCLMYVEWKSSSKIIARCGATQVGIRGDVTVTSRTGGKGTCTVQFRVLAESICPTKEIAVWVDESHVINPSYGRNRPTSPSQLHPDDPLGLSDEANVGQFPEDELYDLFPEGSGNILSESFVPQWYLLENHHGTSFDDLKAGLTCLRRKVNQHKEGPLSFLKSNVMSIVDCLDVLKALQSTLHKDKQEIGNDITDCVENAIIKSKEEADSLFQEMLTRKDKADSTRNALGVLQRFRFLFNLPANIERNIQRGDYDIVINDYARAKFLFHDTEVAVFKKVYQEVDQRIEKFRNMLVGSLRQLPSTIEEQKRLIKYLVNLEAPGDPAWETICHIQHWLLNSMNACKEKYQNSGTNIDGENQDNLQSDIPNVVKFVVEVTEFFSEHFPDLWKLGQSYLQGHLPIKEGVVPGRNSAVSKNMAFKNMVLEATSRVCNLVRVTLLFHTLHSMSIQHLHILGTWSKPLTGETLAPWLPHCIRSIRNCYTSLLKLDLPDDVLNTIQSLIFDLRVHSMTTLFNQASEDVRQLHQCETWTVEIDDNNGSTTQLPLLFENRVVETLQLVRETVLQCGPRETEVFSQINVQATIKQLSQSLIQAFAQALEKLALDKERTQEERHMLSNAPRGGFVSQCTFSSGDNIQEIPSLNTRLLIVLSNCNYTVRSVIPRLQESFQKHGYPDMTLVIKSGQTKFREVDRKLFKEYLEQKCGPVVGSIETTMYGGHFDWKKCPKPTGVSTYIKETIMNMIEVHAEVFAVSPPFLERTVTRIVDAVADELARLYECVSRFTGNGNMQATLDVRALEEAVASYKTNSARKLFLKCRSHLEPFANPHDKELVEEQLKNFRNKMKVQLVCFQQDTEDNIVSV